MQIITVEQIITTFYYFVRTWQECHNVDLMQFKQGLSGFNPKWQGGLIQLADGVRKGVQP